MMRAGRALLGGALLAAAAPSDPVLNDARIAEINSKNLGWKAGRNPRFEGVTEAEYQHLLGVRIPKDAVSCPPPSKVDMSLPAEFDARKVWPQYIHPVLNQESCGGCWAFAASEVLSDRLAIYTNGTTNLVLSPQALIDCDTQDMGCNGGWPTYAADFLLHTGIPTLSCQPFEDATEACAATCTDGTPETLYTYKSWAYATGEDAMMAALQTGPVAVTLAVYGSFESYTGGIYQYDGSSSLMGYHAVKLVGYGVTGASDSPPNTKYWIVQNSWGPTWGEQGFFRMIRGTNNCGIELGALDKGCPIYGVPYTGPHTTVTITTTTGTAASYHYGRPPCREDEEVVHVQGQSYSVCAASCTSDAECPQDLPPGTSGAKPRCGLKDASGKKVCGLHCTDFFSDGCPTSSSCQTGFLPFGYCAYYTPAQGEESIVV